MLITLTALDGHPELKNQSTNDNNLAALPEDKVNASETTEDIQIIPLVMHQLQGEQDGSYNAITSTFGSFDTLKAYQSRNHTV